VVSLGSGVHGGERLRVSDALSWLLEASHLLELSQLGEAVREAAILAGADDAIVYLSDYEQAVLVPLVGGAGADRAVLDIDTTLAGRAFRTMEQLEGAGTHGRRLWVPMVDGTDRVGVLELELPTRGPDGLGWKPFAVLVAELVVCKGMYGDDFTVARRRRPMSLRAELQRGLLPPLTLASRRVVISGMLEPCYDVAGDAFDYALNGDVAHVAIFDAMGHSLEASLIAAVAIASYRNSRRQGLGLLESITAMDDAVAQQFHGEGFATAVLGELDLASGKIGLTVAGHPEPLLVRGGRVVPSPGIVPCLPLGLGVSGPRRTEITLEPGDRLLLFTDGIVEARSPDGGFFGERRLVDLLSREEASGRPAPETMRRLIRAVVAHQQGALQDDATLLFVEWLGRSGRAVSPSEAVRQLP
jgi:hypothetical protein